MGLSKRINQIGDALKDTFNHIINPTVLDQNALSLGFVKRFSSRLKGSEFVKALIIESVDGASSTLRRIVDTISTINSEAKISPQAFSKRLNSSSALSLMKFVFENTLRITLDGINKICFNTQNVGLLKSFNKVYIEDSTETVLNPELRDHFKGSGGHNGNGDASFKVDLIYEYTKKAMTFFQVTDRREHDGKLGRQILQFLQQRDLVIRDLGYSSVELFKEIEKIGAFFLSRLHGQIKVYLQLDQEALSLGTYLETKTKKSGFVDTLVYLTDSFFPCRLIAYRVPKDIEKIRVADYVKECKRKKRAPNKEYIKKLRFTIFITNVPMTIWTADVVGTVYRLRWQIELIFKNWKDDLSFDYIVGVKPIRIQCLIYARLTAIIILFTVYSSIDRVAVEIFERETSIHKVVDWVKNQARMIQIMLQGFSKSLWICCVESCTKILCKDRRIRKKSTKELLEMEARFCATF